MTRPIYIADCETDPFKYLRVPKPFIWGLYTLINGKQILYKKFDTTAEFMEHIIKIECIVYAHNGGKFDWLFVLDWIEPFSDVSIINGRLSKFKIGSAEFRDSYNILPIPLSAYIKDEFDYKKMEKNVRHKHMEEIEKYLKNDCIYLYEIVERFILDYGLNLTLAGAAMKTWQKISGEKPPKTDKEYYQSLNHFYYGGRVECFKAGIFEHDFNVVDINSAYPFAMTFDHPYGQTKIISHQLPENEKETQRAFITLSCVSRGALPFRADDGSLSFPRDNVQRVYNVTGWEYLAGLKTGTIENVEVLEVTTFTDKINFRDYVGHFSAMKIEAKETGDKAGYILAKLFLNSLYGKFGANADKYKKYMFCSMRYIEAAEQDGYDYSGEAGKWALVSRGLEESEQRYYDIAVAASITGFVRAYMWESLNKCTGVIYCDTDSIVAADTSKLNYHATTLGAWDIEAQCDYGAVAGKKLYCFRDKNGKWKSASKGVRIDHNEIIKVAQGETVIYQNDAPTMSVRKETTFLQRSVARNAKIN